MQPAKVRWQTHEYKQYGVGGFSFNPLWKTSFLSGWAGCWIYLIQNCKKTIAPMSRKTLGVTALGFVLIWVFCSVERKCKNNGEIINIIDFIRWLQPSDAAIAEDVLF